MQLGIHYGSATDFPVFLDDIVAYEEAGADVVWLGESYGYDSATALGALAARTHTVQLGSAIMAVQTRTAALLAMTMAGLDALSGGRAILGLGASGPQVIEGLHDVPFGHPIERTRAIVNACRTLWRGDREASLRTQPSGGTYKALKLMHPPKRPIPIYLAAIGPKNVALAAEVAEGWMPAFFWPDRHDRVWGDALDLGRRNRPEELGALQVVVSAPFAIGDAAESARRGLRRGLAHYLGGMGTPEVNFYLQLAHRYGIGRDAERVQALYLDGEKAKAAEAVPDALVEGTSLIGTSDEVATKLRAYSRAGVTILNVSPGGRSLAERVEQVRLARSLLNQIRVP